jgi:hypothetical protein
MGLNMNTEIKFFLQNVSQDFWVKMWGFVYWSIFNVGQKKQL